jgi:hypothetical protein
MEVVGSPGPWRLLRAFSFPFARIRPHRIASPAFRRLSVTGTSSGGTVPLRACYDVSMRKPSRQYLEDLRGLEVVLLRQLEQSTRPVKTKTGIERVPLTGGPRQHLEELLTLCRREIKRAGKVVGK